MKIFIIVALTFCCFRTFAGHEPSNVEIIYNAFNNEAIEVNIKNWKAKDISGKTISCNFESWINCKPTNNFEGWSDIDCNDTYWQGNEKLHFYANGSFKGQLNTGGPWGKLNGKWFISNGLIRTVVTPDKHYKRPWSISNNYPLIEAIIEGKSFNAYKYHYNDGLRKTRTRVTCSIDDI